MTRISDDKMEQLNDTIMKAIFKNDIKTVKYYLNEDSKRTNVNINRICSNGMTLIGAAAQTGNLAMVKCLLDLTSQLQHLDFKNDNHQIDSNRDRYLQLDLSATAPKKVKRNIGYFVVCRETEDLGDGPTPDGMEALEWDMEVEQNSSHDEEPSSDINIYHWYADILSRSAVMLQSPEHDLARLDMHGLSVLHYAVRSDNPTLTDFLLHSCPVLGVNQADQTGFSPLHVAALYASPDTLKLLIKRGANLESICRQRQTPLHIACYNNRLENVRTLIEYGAIVNACDYQERTPLTLAVGSSNLEMVKLLINAGARLNLEESDGNTPLRRAVLNNDVDMVKLLLESGARAVHSHFLLHTAARNCNLLLINALMHRQGTHALNTRDDEGNTPLMIACAVSSIPIVTRLLQLGANANTANILSGLTALHMCVQEVGDETILEQIVSLLIEYGADLDAVSSQGSPLWYAIVLERPKIASLLVKHGADVRSHLRQEDRLYCDVLSLARRHGDTNLVHLLVCAGFPVRDMLLPLQPEETHYDYLKNNVCNAASLRDLCRLKIRSKLPRKRIVSNIQKLPLPVILHKYLALDIL